ncbi:MAG TPA: molybdenum cofactor guanylyltransferase MobA [Microvirga sp.]|nr:molybdenum cofactor guanylyltransferase MobA [Microvirga sp.]
MGPFPATLGVILAGGLSRRMGGNDKTLLRLQGQTLLAHVTNRLGPQCESIVLSANGDPSRFAETGLPVVPDTVPDHPGPLAGLLAAMDWCVSKKPFVEWIVSVPCDTPFIPTDLVERLHAARNDSHGAMACAASGSRQHYVTGLWSVSLRERLRRALVLDGMRRVEDWVKSHDFAIAVWPLEPIDPFFNINTPADLGLAASMLNCAPLDTSGPWQVGSNTEEGCDG